MHNAFCTKNRKLCECTWITEQLFVYWENLFKELIIVLDNDAILRAETKQIQKKIKDMQFLLSIEKFEKF